MGVVNFRDLEIGSACWDDWDGTRMDGMRMRNVACEHSEFGRGHSEDQVTVETGSVRRVDRAGVGVELSLCSIERGKGRFDIALGQNVDWGEVERERFRGHDEEDVLILGLEKVESVMRSC